MRNLFLLAGAGMMLALGAPAEAKPGKAKGPSAAKVLKAKPGGKVHMNGRDGWIDRDLDGIDDRLEARGNRWGAAVCPPGLAKKNPPCVPPGQVGRIGGGVPAGWDFVDYDDLPLDIRTRYDLDDDWRYAYYGRRLYVVDPTTNLITRIINSVIF